MGFPHGCQLKRLLDSIKEEEPFENQYPPKFALQLAMTSTDMSTLRSHNAKLFWDHAHGYGPTNRTCKSTTLVGS